MCSFPDLFLGLVKMEKNAMSMGRILQVPCPRILWHRSRCVDPKCDPRLLNMAVGQNQWYHFGVHPL